jgi:hypothetical protein
MTETNLTVILEDYIWDELQLDVPARYERALNAFYMHYGLESVKRLLELSQNSTEVTEVMRVAPLLGLDPLRDYIKRRSDI